MTAGGLAWVTITEVTGLPPVLDLECQDQKVPREGHH
jgi:hypothetical protein